MPFGIDKFEGRVRIISAKTRNVCEEHFSLCSYLHHQDIISWYHFANLIECDEM